MAMIEEILKRYLLPEEDYIFGLASLSGLLGDKFTGFNSGISIGKRLEKNIIDPVCDGPTKEYYSHYRQINKDLAILTAKITGDLKENNIEALAIEPTVTTEALDTIYAKSLTTELSHKMVATRAGLGWIGKTDLLISRKFGPRLRLVTILLREKLKSVRPPVSRSYCGSCTICVDACPAKAANGLLWNKDVGRDEFFDPWKCREKCTEFGRVKLGANARVCGICVAVCPIGT